MLDLIEGHDKKNPQKGSQIRYKARATLMEDVKGKAIGQVGETVWTYVYHCPNVSDCKLVASGDWLNRD